jgi:hypothetical protein
MLDSPGIQGVIGTMRTSAFISGGYITSQDIMSQYFLGYHGPAETIPDGLIIPNR